MTSWSGFQAAAAELAASGKRLLRGADGSPIAFLGTASPAGTPNLAPVCPIFSADELFLSIAKPSPKLDDLAANPRYVLHAFLGEHDEEFQISGLAHLVTDRLAIAQVHADIQFVYQPDHPVFHLTIERALWCYWENAGQADTYVVKRRWSS